MKASFIRILFTALLLIITNITLAADIGYQVEVIIFEDTTGTYKHSEKWPETITTEEKKHDTNIINTTLTDDTKTINTTATDKKGVADDVITTENDKKDNIDILNITETDNEVIEVSETKTDVAETVFFKDIDKENYRLNKQAEKLEKHPDYRILVHKAWKQPGLDRENALPMKMINDINSEDSDSVAKSYIDGEITLIMSRYLHINTNLIFHRLIPEPFNTYSNIDESSINSFKDYPLFFERRMRSKEIHYIDHPLVGIIVLAIPFKIESEEAPQKETYKTIQ